MICVLLECIVLIHSIKGKMGVEMNELRILPYKAEHYKVRENILYTMYFGK